MKLSPVPDTVALAGLRMVKSVCCGPNHEPLSDLQLSLINGIQKYILKTNFNVSQLSWISPEELSALVKDQEFKRRMVNGGIIAACVNGEMSSSALERLEAYTKALGTEGKPLRTAMNLAHHNLVLARFNIVRKSLPGVKVKQTIQNEGVLAIVRQFFPLLGIELPEVTEKYKKLEGYPEGSLGKEFMNYLDHNQFPLPGQKNSGPEIIVLHDCLHILGNYGTTPAEEIEVASFQAGCQFEDPIYGLLFGLAQYHLNIQVAPVAPSESLNADPEKLIAAFARGCAVNRDMWRDFNPWDHFQSQVTDLRKTLNILPKAVASQ